MPTLRPFVLGTVVLALGFAAGVYVQHRWPLGRWLRGDAPVLTPVDQATLARVRSLPRNQRLVIVAAGQSNAANYGGSRRAAGPGVYVFADGRLFPAIDPLPGGDNHRGSVWTRLGAQLIRENAAEAVIFAVAARGSTAAAEWAPGGRYHSQLTDALGALVNAGLPVDYILWQQGESEAGDPGFSGTAYHSSVSAIMAACHKISPETKFVPAQATRRDSLATNEQIRIAQAALGRLPGALPGPDLDTLQDRFRSDGVHFNDAGLDAAAGLWLATLRPAIGKPPGSATRGAALP